MTLDLSRLPRYQSVFVSTHEGDAVLSCAARLIAAGARGGKTLIVTLFRVGDEQPFSEPGSLAIGMPAAPLRDPSSYGSYRTLVFGRRDRDDGDVCQAASLIEEVFRRSEARDLYLPLGVGGHVDRQLAHEAGLRAVPPRAGRNVFFYEERPESLVPGAVRMRLAQLGARLPPAAVQVAAEGSLPGFLYRYNMVPQRRVAPRGLTERLACTRLAARDWIDARAWQPQRAFGPRVQPVLQPVQGDSLAAIREMVHAEGERRGAPPASAHRLLRYASDYAHGLGGCDHLERYWLLLPAREDEGRAELPASLTA
jgi:hypothetical protein